MDDYYIRTPENDRSRGPFDVDKLHSLAEAGQVTANTLYYDETKEEWVPIGANADLKAAIFPERKRLSLSIGKEPKSKEDDDEAEEEKEEDERHDVADMLAAADGETEDTQHLKKERESFEKAALIAPMGLALIMMASAVFLLFPHLATIQSALGGNGSITSLFGYPFLLIAFYDLIVALALLLAVTEVYPFVRGRMMLGLGFGAYMGWALQAPELILAFFLAGIGPFWATLAKRVSLMILALSLGIVGNGFLAYLSLTGRFDGFFEVIHFSFGS